MKLTKGKISKLYNRKKQTLRKKKPSKRKSSKKNRTFRRKRGVNLSTKTLKRIRYKKHKGGKNDEDKTVVEPNPTTVEEPVPDGVEEEPVAPSTTEEEPALNGAEEPAPNEEEPALNGAEEPVPNNVAEEEPVVPNEEESTPDAAASEEESTPGVVSRESLTNSIDNIITYMSDKISDKVAANISNGTEGPQNGFRAVNAATEKMASSGGKKSRKFKVTKKNKTRYHK